MSEPGWSKYHHQSPFASWQKGSLEVFCQRLTTLLRPHAVCSLRRLSKTLPKKHRPSPSQAPPFPPDGRSLLALPLEIAVSLGKPSDLFVICCTRREPSSLLCNHPD